MSKSILYSSYNSDKIKDIKRKYSDHFKDKYGSEFKFPEYATNILTEQMDNCENTWKEAIKLINFKIKEGIMEEFMDNSNIPLSTFKDDAKKTVNIDYDTFISTIFKGHSDFDKLIKEDRGVLEYYMGKIFVEKYGPIELSMLMGVTRLFYNKENDVDFSDFKMNVLDKKSSRKYAIKRILWCLQMAEYNSESAKSIKNILRFFETLFKNLPKISRFSTYRNINDLVDSIVKHNAIFVCDVEGRDKYIDMIKDLTIRYKFDTFSHRNTKNFKLLIEYLKNVKGRSPSYPYSYVNTTSDNIRGIEPTRIVKSYSKLNSYYTLLPMIFLTSKYNRNFFNNYGTGPNSVNIGIELHYTLLSHYLEKINYMRKNGLVKSSDDKLYFYIYIKKGISLSCLESGKACPVLTTHELGALMVVVSCIVNNVTRSSFIKNFIEKSIDFNLISEKNLGNWCKKNGYWDKFK